MDGFFTTCIECAASVTAPRTVTEAFQRDTREASAATNRVDGAA